MLHYRFTEWKIPPTVPLISISYSWDLPFSKTVMYHIILSEDLRQVKLKYKISMIFLYLTFLNVKNLLIRTLFQIYYCFNKFVLVENISITIFTKLTIKIN